MFRNSSLLSIIVTFACVTGFVQSAFCQSSPAKEEEAAKKAFVRLITVSSLQEDHKVVLASKSEEGEWTELGEIKLRSPFISEWLPVKAGQLFLATREAEGLKEIAAFKYPSGTKRAVVVLLPDAKNGRYLANLFDPSKLGFKKGSTMIINYSPQNASVALGAKKVTLKPGEKKVEKAQPDPNGMFRLLAAYESAEKKPVFCYDRYLPMNEDTRDLVLLFPDAMTGIRLFILPEFGPYE